MQCILCDTPDSRQIETHGDYKLFQCLSCDLVFSSPMKDPGKDFYESHYETRIVEPPIIRWAHRMFLKKPSMRKEDLLDIGCGRGDFLYLARKKGFHVKGIDIDGHAVTEGKRRYGLKDLYCATIMNIPALFGDHKFDVITFFEVLEHLENPNDFICMVKNLLRSGGYIALSVPNRNRLVKSKGDRPPKHFTRWSDKPLRVLLEKNGFEVLDIKRKKISFDEMNDVLGVYGGFTGIRKKVEKEITMAIKTKTDKSQSIKNMYNVFNLLARIKRLLVSFISIPALLVLRLMKKEGSTIYVTARYK